MSVHRRADELHEQLRPHNLVHEPGESAQEEGCEDRAPRGRREHRLLTLPLFPGLLPLHREAVIDQIRGAPYRACSKFDARKLLRHAPGQGEQDLYGIGTLPPEHPGSLIGLHAGQSGTLDVDAGPSLLQMLAHPLTRSLGCTVLDGVPVEFIKEDCRRIHHRQI